ncbi:glycosyltransferase family 39 protein [Actinoplanes sp. URMC 104]|uniref:glycosyltransferase family 39 protein n=1 Tax=Actinoplanes sp. URMC 104 TaxID=3423409 RepID=UPI003F1BB8EC
MTTAPVLDRPAVTAPRRDHDVAVLAAITTVGALLRLWPVRSVWLDEAISIGQARLPFGRMLHDLMYADLHPPLWGIVLWADVRLFGDGPLAVRIPSLLLGTACIPLMCLLGRELFDRRTGLVAAAFTALAPLAVWYSGEARMYALYLFFAVLALLGQARAVRRGDLTGWALFVLGSAGLFASHYFGVLQLLAQHLVFAVLAVRQPRLRKPWLLSSVATAVVLLPLAPYVLEQLSHAGAPGGAPADAGGTVSLYVVLANLVWGLWGYHSDAAMTQLVALWPVLVLGVLALLGKGRSWATTLLAGAVAVPVLLAFAISLKARNFFEVRYFLSVLPALLLLGARAVTGWFTSTAARAAAAGVVALTLLAGLADQQLDPANPRVYDYRSAFAYADAQAQPGDLIVYAPDYLGYVVDYYDPAAPAQPLQQAAPGHRGRIVLLASFLDQPGTAAQVGQALSTLEQGGRAVRQTKHWENVTLWILA